MAERLYNTCKQQENSCLSEDTIAFKYYKIDIITKYVPFRLQWYKSRLNPLSITKDVAFNLQ